MLLQNLIMQTGKNLVESNKYQKQSEKSLSHFTQRRQAAAPNWGIIGVLSSHRRHRRQAACFGLTFTDLMLYCTKNLTCKSFLKVDFLGNRRSAVLRRIFCAGKSVSSAALLGVMQGRDTKPGAKETSKTVLRKFPRKSIIKNAAYPLFQV